MRLLLLLLSLTLVAVAGDWPIHRGNSQLTGVAPGTLGTALGLRWRADTKGPVKGGPVVVGKRLYVGSGDFRVLCLDTDTGKVLWEFATEAEIEATPLVIDGAVYIGSSDNCFYALKADTGELLWKVTSDDKFLGPANAFRTADKQLCIVVGGYDTNLYCLQAATGKTIWTYTTDSYINGAPAIDDDRIVVGGCDAFVHIVDLEGKAESKVQMEAYVAGSAAIVGKRAYLGNYANEVVAINLDTGEQAWRYTFRQFPFFSSPAVTDTHLVIGGRDKYLHCLNPENGKLIWRFKTRRRVDSSPVICGDKVVATSEDGHLYLLNLADGKELWKYLIGKPIVSSPAVIDGHIYVGCDDGAIYAFGPAERPAP